MNAVRKTLLVGFVRSTRISYIIFAFLVQCSAPWGMGEDPDIDRSTWPESPIMVTNTDAVIESFWNFKLGYTTRWKWSADAENALVRQKGWNRFQLNWGATNTPGRVSIERDYDLFVKGFESLILKTKYPPGVSASISIVIDGERRNIVQDQPGSNDTQEVVGALEGERLEKVIIEYTTEDPGKKEMILRWLLLSREGIPWVGPKPDFDRFLEPSAVNDFSPGLNILHDDADFVRLRKLTQQPAWADHWKKDRQAATEVLAGDTDYPVRKYTLYSQVLGGRVHQKSPVEFNLALKAALIGLVAEDEAQMRFAAKQAIRLALTERWEDGFENHFTGPFWDHSAFSENVATIQAALLLDLCWNWLTPEGRALIAQAIREKGLPNLEVHREAFANQGVRFHRGLLLGKLALSKAGLGMPLSPENVRYEITSMNRLLDPLIRQDGTYLEGVGYGLGTSKATFMTYVAASRFLGVPVNEIVHPRMLAGMRFAAEKEGTIPSETALFLVGALQAGEFRHWGQPDSLVAGGFPEMTNYGLHSLWYEQSDEKEGAVGAFPEFSHYPEGGWVFARDHDDSRAAINFESGLWSGGGHSWTRKNSVEVEAWGETLLVRRFHVGYKDGRYAETARTAAYNTFTPGSRNQDINGTAGRGSDLHIAQNLAHTAVMEADNATAWTEWVELAQRRILFIRPHAILVEDTARLTKPETGVQSWNSLFPFQSNERRTTLLQTEKGKVEVTLLAPADAPMHIAEDSVHRDNSQEKDIIVPVYRTTYTTQPATNHRFLTLITLTPADGQMDAPTVRTEGENGEFLEITQSGIVTRITRITANDKNDLWGVETDGSYAFATMENGRVVEAAAFNASFIKFKDKVSRGNGFLFLEKP